MDTTTSERPKDAREILMDRYNESLTKDAERTEADEARALVHTATKVGLADSVDRVLDLCDYWDKIAKGETSTTRSIRRTILGRPTT